MAQKGGIEMSLYYTYEEAEKALKDAYWNFLKGVGSPSVVLSRACIRLKKGEHLTRVMMDLLGESS